MADQKKDVLIKKLQIEGGKATPAPPVGPALGSTGINIMQFTKEFNEKTAHLAGMKVPVVVYINKKDKSFSFITKVPPVTNLLKKELGLSKGSAKSNKDKVAKITKEQLKKIAELKMQDLNAASMETAMSMIAGTARSMGITVEE